MLEDPVFSSFGTVYIKNLLVTKGFQVYLKPKVDSIQAQRKTDQYGSFNWNFTKSLCVLHLGLGM